jgi:hypothetical protein
MNDLRDEFANSALQGIMAGLSARAMDANNEILARVCYNIADAMLAARNMEQEPPVEFGSAAEAQAVQ